jgi:UPF0755 protein
MKTNTKIILTITAAILLIGGYFGLQFYNTYLAANILTTEKYLYLKTGSNLADLVSNITSNNILINNKSFVAAADKMQLENKIKPGRYLLKAGMNNRTLINKIKSGNQDPVSLKFQNLRKKENFAAFLAKNMEADSLAFIKVLDSAALISKYGLNSNNIYTLFIPNTYEMYWNTTPANFLDKMYAEYLKFWDSSRKQKAQALKLSPSEVYILASIVDAEAIFNKEMPIIAGLYLNRLNKGILLQADPTVIFANNDFTVKRVTNKLLAVNSKYNTYKYAGLPPGPIMMPSIAAIDAVLNKNQNDYLYMCAKEDFSGYHNFAANVQQHDANAKKYRAALNNRKIFK